MHRKRARAPPRAGTLSVHIAEFKKRGKKGVKKTLRITLIQRKADTSGIVQILQRIPRFEFESWCKIVIGEAICGHV